MVVVAELAMQIKDRTSNGGARRIYAALLADPPRWPSEERAAQLRFLALGLRSVDPSPQQVRELTKHIFLGACGATRAAADLNQEFLIQTNSEWDFWSSRVDDFISTHAEAFTTAASADFFLRMVALKASLITTGQALRMPGGPVVLFRMSYGCFEPRSPYFIDVFMALLAGWPAFGQPRVASDLNAFGEYLIEHPEPPWLQGRPDGGLTIDWGHESPVRVSRPGPLSRAAYLGAAAILLIVEETRLPRHIERRLGPLRHMAPYLARRQGFGRGSELPSLLVPDEFKQTFRDWAEGRISVTAT